MTVHYNGGVILLVGKCGIEDVESFLEHLTSAQPSVDVSKADTIHTALWQVMIATKASIRGRPLDTFYADFVLPAIASS